MSAPSRYVIKVFLYGIEPVIWRRFSIPVGATFAGLHTAIQQGMGWKDEQLHEFRHGKGKRLMSVIGPDHEEVPKGDSFEDEEKFTLKEFVGRRRLPLRLLYRYDFHADWVHEIAIEETSDAGKGDRPILLGGERACPPEDTGGPEGYMAALQGDLEWLDDDYDPAKFDPKKVTFGKPVR
ncbi:MAG: plasmid pRiA4b ORF-3 family protein [Akkermansiaceae bacterium]|nr:plasmid pRiA4b ORF-3 family protein [Akkermansiaceae bacterium]